LVHFQEAVFPPKALADGLEAEVLLRLVVGADGSVTEVLVLEPVGHGFDAAAVAAAQQFVFTPAQRDGVSIPVAIKYVYRFTNEVVETVETDSLALQTGNLEGQILISGVERPLAGARVTLERLQVAAPAAGQEPVRGRSGAGGTSAPTAAPAGALTTQTDAKGHWEFAELAPGTYRVEVVAEGYSPLVSEEEVVQGEATAITYRIAEQTDEDVIEVVVKGVRPPREVTRRTLQRREISRVPGTGGDALRSIQSLPGVARPPGLAGLLIVRGSGPQDTNTFVDGALVPLIYHFGGLSSVIPTELLDRIDFYPGNFSAKYGRVMGGVVDVGLRSPDTSCTDDQGRVIEGAQCFHGLAQGDLIDTRLLLQGPLGDDWSFAIAGRRSWVDTWLKPVLEEAGAGVSTAPVYFDYQAILEHKPTKNSKFRTQLYGSDDILRILINNPSAQDPGFGGQLEFGTAFWRLQAIYEQKLSEDWALYSTLAAGRDLIRFGIGAVRFDLDAFGVEYRSELSWKAAPGVKINGGLDFLFVPADVHVRAPLPPRPGEPSPGPFSTRPLLDSRSETEIFRPAWYVEGEVQATERLLFVPGLRVDFARDTGFADFNPRISARYTLRGAASDISGDGAPMRKTVVKGGVGIYSQPPTFQETDDVFGSGGLHSNQSIHYTVGAEQELTDQVDVSVEGYYKDLNDLVSRAPTEDITGFVYNNAGSGAVTGLEALLKYKADDRFFGWLAYTLSRSTRQNGPLEDEYLFQFDQTHIMTVLGSYRLGNGWEVGARFRLVSGNMDTPVSKRLPALYAADAGSYAPLQGAPFSERLPLFHQLDLRVEKNWKFDDWRLMAYLDVWNAYNHAAIEDVQYNFDFSESAPQQGLPIVPSFGLRGEF
jgi:TonB family protein